MQPMSAKQYKSALERYGLTQGYASWLFGGKTKTSGRRWAAEGAPYSVAMFIKIMDNSNITPEDLEAWGHEFRSKLRRAK